MIGFRVDANEMIATGHLMRCITMAREFLKKGEECLFFLAEEKETRRLEENGFDYQVLHTDWRDMESEESVLENALKKAEVDFLIVDSYQATKSYLVYLEQFVPVLYIDDIGREVYPVSAVLRYAIWPEDMHFRQMYQGKETLLLAGMQYIPLREEFCTGGQDKVREKSILITTGGTDTYNIAGRLVTECLQREDLELYSFHVIVGSLNPFEKELIRITERSERAHLHKDVRNMSDYMRTCELAVSAGGTTLFELCACKIPTVCFSFADNQMDFTEELGKRNVMLYAGDAREKKEIASVITEYLCHLSKDKEVQWELAARMGELVDGEGTKRIVHAVQNMIMKKGIYLRKVKETDCDLLFGWANDLEVRKNSFQSSMISYENHRNWFQGKLVDADCEIFLCIADGKEVGQVRVEYKEREGVISYSIAKEYQGMGYGQRMLLLVEEKAAGRTEWLAGYVKLENKISQYVFEKLGYEKEWEGNYLVYRKHIV